MFAIFRYKPSPFCLLDEIDAPLDDANIGRFVEMLRGMLDRTQFIVITHNRKTMEIANRLYGVTMEEPGVSKVISAADELRAARPAPAGEPWGGRPRISPQGERAMPKTMTRRGVWAAVLLAGAVGAAGCEVRAGEGDFSLGFWQGSAQDTWERTYTVAPGGRVEVLNVNGEIRAEAAPGAPST